MPRLSHGAWRHHLHLRRARLPGVRLRHPTHIQRVSHRFSRRAVTPLPPTNRLSDQPTNRPIDRPTNRPTDQSTDRPTNQSTNRPTVKSTNQPSDKSTGRPTDRPTNQPIDQPTDQPTNQPTSRPTPTYQHTLTHLPATKSHIHSNLSTSATDITASQLFTHFSSRHPHTSASNTHTACMLKLTTYPHTHTHNPIHMPITSTRDVLGPYIHISFSSSTYILGSHI